MKDLDKKNEELQASERASDLFRTMDAIICAEDENRFDEFICAHGPRLLKEDPVLFIGKHVHFYLCQDRTDRALSVLKTYQEAPFISMTVEDFMKDLETEIRRISEPKNRAVYSDTELYRDLYSGSEERIGKAIRALSEMNIRSYIPFVRKTLSSALPYRYKILLLFILVEQGVNDRFTVKRDDGSEFSFVPSRSLLPFDEPRYAECADYMRHLNESPSILDTAMELLNTVLVRRYPESIIEDASSSCAAGEIFVYLAKEYHQEENDEEALIRNTGMDREELEEYLAKVRAILAE